MFNHRMTLFGFFSYLHPKDVNYKQLLSKMGRITNAGTDARKTNRKESKRSEANMFTIALLN